MTVRGSQIKTVKSALERFASILNEETRLTFLDRSYDNNDVLKYQAIVHEAPCSFISELNTLEIRPDEQPNLTPDLLADIHSLFDKDAADQFPDLLKTCEPTAPLNPTSKNDTNDYIADFDSGQGSKDQKLVCTDRSRTSEIFERADWSGPRTKKI